MIYSFEAASQKFIMLMLVISSCLTVAFSKFKLNNNIFDDNHKAEICYIEYFALREYTVCTSVQLDILV